MCVGLSMAAFGYFVEKKLILNAGKLRVLPNAHYYQTKI
jgi:hypothetical protein